MNTIDPGDGATHRPVPAHIRSLRGKYRQWVHETTEEARRAARAEEAELEDARAERLWGAARRGGLRRHNDR